jgi:hypothetical protein
MDHAVGRSFAILRRDGVHTPAIGRSRILPPRHVCQLAIFGLPTIRPEPIESVVSLISVVLY